jgi:hypothetical protein
MNKLAIYNLSALVCPMPSINYSGTRVFDGFFLMINYLGIWFEYPGSYV